MITKMTDSLGNLVKFRLLLGQYYDLAEVKTLIEDTDFQILLADRAFYSD